MTIVNPLSKVFVVDENGCVIFEGVVSYWNMKQDVNLQALQFGIEMERRRTFTVEGVMLESSQVGHKLLLKKKDEVECEEML